jgi:hypothetical protein
LEEYNKKKINDALSVDSKDSRGILDSVLGAAK